MRLTTLLPTLDGPPPSLPRVLDLASERWWSLAPRLRLLLVGLGIALVLLALATARGHGAGDAPVEVVVAARDLPAGHQPRPGDLRTVRWPERLAPASAWRATGPGPTPAGTLTSPLPRGAVLTEGHLSAGGLGALVGDGRAALALPRDLVPEPRVGTRLGVVPTDGPGVGGPPIAARILRVEADRVWIDLDEDRAGPLAAAAARGAIAVVVRPTSAEGSSRTSDP